jgi:hypothetical protein
MKVKANIVIIHYRDPDVQFACTGQYYSTGFIMLEHQGRQLAVDPENFHAKDPKRLYIVDEAIWSDFRIRSIILDSKTIKKNW